MSGGEGLAQYQIIVLEVVGKLYYNYPTLSILFNMDQPVKMLFGNLYRVLQNKVPTLVFGFLFGSETHIVLIFLFQQ